MLADSDTGDRSSGSGPAQEFEFGRRLLSRVGGNAVAVASLRGAGLMLNLGVSLALGRMLGVANFGAYAAGMGLANILSTLTTLGTGPLAVRGVASYIESGRLSLLRGLIVRTGQTVLISSCAVGVLTAGAILLAGGGSPVRHAMLVAALIVPLVALGSLSQSLLQGLQRMTAAFAPPTVLRPLVLLTILGLFALFGQQLSAQGAILLQGAAMLVALGLTIPLLRNSIPGAVRATRSTFEMRSWVRSAAGLGLTTGLTALAANAVVTAAGVIAGARDAGQLGAAVRVSIAVVLVSWGSNEAFQPVVARLYASGAREALQPVVTALTRRVALITIAMAGAVAMLAHPLLAVFGPGFGHGSAALRLLCLAAVVNAAASSNGTLLMMTEHERSAAVAAAIGLLTTAALCLLLIPPLGGAGGAGAYLAGTTLRNVIASWLTWVRLDLDSTVFGVRWHKGRARQTCRTVR